MNPPESEAETKNQKKWHASPSHHPRSLSTTAFTAVILISSRLQRDHPSLRGIDFYVDRTTGVLSNAIFRSFEKLKAHSLTAWA